LIRNAKIDLLGYIEVPIQVKINLCLLGKLIVDVAGEEEDTHDIEEDEKSDLGLQANGFFKETPVREGSDPLNRAGKRIGGSWPYHILMFL
jgi:hypothetical protein